MLRHVVLLMWFLCMIYLRLFCFVQFFFHSVKINKKVDAEKVQRANRLNKCNS